MQIHREGYKILWILLIVLILFNGLTIWLWPDFINIHITIAFVSLIIFLLVLQFFRNPNIEILNRDDAIISPADGKVISIQKIKEPEYFNEDRIRISIFMSPTNVHVNRSPISGKVIYIKYHAGKYLVAFHPKSSIKNERNTIVVENNLGHKILFRQIAGTVARRIRCYIKEGQPVKQGEEIGFIKFGSRVDIFMPLETNIYVSEGQKTKAGKTTLGII